MSHVRTKDGVPVASDFAFHEPPLVEDFSTGLVYSVNLAGNVIPASRGMSAAQAVSGEIPTTYSHTLSAAMTPSGAWILDLVGVSITGTTGIDILNPQDRLDVYGGTLDTFNRGIDCDDVAQFDFNVLFTEFKNGAGIAVNVEAPIRDLKILGGRFLDGHGHTIRIGNNTYSEQSGWESVLIAFNYVENSSYVVASPNDVSGTISYAPFSRVIGNAYRDINGYNNTDTAFVYVKSPRGLVALNVGDGLESTGTPLVHGVNLKGTERGSTASPNGFGSTAALNAFRGQDVGGGIQMESNEQAAIGNYLEAFKFGFEIGSGDISYGLLALNRCHQITGVSASKGITAAMQGQVFTEIGNIYRGFDSGPAYNIVTAETFDRLLALGIQAEGVDSATGIGFEVDSSDTDGASNVLLADSIIGPYNQIVSLENVNGALLSNLIHGASNSASRPYFFTTCKNIRARNAVNFTKQTTDASNVNIFQVGLSDGNVYKATMHALARKSDGSAVESMRCDFLFKHEASTCTLVASGTLDRIGGSSLPADALNAAVVSNRAMLRIKGIASETWDWTINIDFEIH